MEAQKKTKISVIVPVHNMDKYLNKCLKSIISQTIFLETEILCIDDGSTDNSFFLIKQASKAHKNITLLSQKNLGVSFARNRGIKEAKGEFIAFMDPDDYYLEANTLEVLYNNAIKYRVKICGGSFSEDRFKGKWIKKKFTNIYKKYTFLKRELIHFEDYQFDYGFQRFIYQRDFILKNSLFFPSYIRFQDPPFFVNAMIKAKIFLALPDFTYCYRSGHQKLNWDEKRVCDLLKGLSDNFQLSGTEKLERLHSLTFYRLTEEYRDRIMELLGHSKKTYDLLHKMQDFIYPELLDDPSKYKRYESMLLDFNKRSMIFKIRLKRNLLKLKSFIVGLIKRFIFLF